MGKEQQARLQVVRRAPEFSAGTVLELLSKPTHADHIIELYEDDDFLVETVAHYLGTGLAGGESVVAIIAAERRAAVLARLAQNAIDVERARQSGQLTVLDAASTLAAITVDGMPDADRFKARLTPLIDACRQRTPKAGVRAYGDMVDLLWRQGQQQAAVRLEELWSELCAGRSFSLLCAYALGDFFRDPDSQQLKAICRAHTHLFDKTGSLKVDPGEGAVPELLLLKQKTLALETELQSRKRFEAALREALHQRRRVEAELRQSNRDLDQFASVASHDLKAPLLAIANLAQWLEEDLGDTLNAQSREQMRLLRDRAQRMETLIDAILNYSRVGRHQPLIEVVDVGQLMAEVIELLRPAGNVKITVDPMPTFETERVALYQVFQNLLSNAIKYTRRTDPQVTVRVVDEDDSYHFSVEDNGQGIAPKFHELIWHVFARVESTADVEGTGIGLSVVRKITEMHGGKVWVQSTVGSGSTFHVRWPKHSVRSSAAS